MRPRHAGDPDHGGVRTVHRRPRALGPSSRSGRRRGRGWSPPTTAPPSTTAPDSRRCRRRCRPAWSRIRCCTSRCATRKRDALARLLGDVDPQLYNICADAIVNSTLSHLSWLEPAAGSVLLEDLLSARCRSTRASKRPCWNGTWSASTAPSTTANGRPAGRQGKRRGKGDERHSPSGEGAGSETGDGPEQQADLERPRADGHCASRARHLAERMIARPAARRRRRAAGGRGRAVPRMARAHHPRPRRRRRALHAARAAGRPAQGAHTLGAAAAHPARPRTVHAAGAVLVAAVALLPGQPGPRPFR
jgi:hypothetical protein